MEATGDGYLFTIKNNAIKRDRANLYDGKIVPIPNPPQKSDIAYIRHR